MLLTKAFLTVLLGIVAIAALGAGNALAVEAESMIENETFSELGIEKAKVTLI